MRQFYETYLGDKKVPPLVAQLPWAHHIVILEQCKRPAMSASHMTGPWQISYFMVFS